MIELIGWISSFAFTLSGVPIAYYALKNKTTDAPYLSITLILLGSFGMVVYELNTAQSLPQIADFGICFICWSIVATVKIFSFRAKVSSKRADT